MFRHTQKLILFNEALFLIGIVFCLCFLYNPQQEVEVNLPETLIISEKQSQELKENPFLITRDNSILAISEPCFSKPKNSENSQNQNIRRINVVVTAYSSSLWETDADPYITAAGTVVRDGIVANNGYPFGTKIRLPEIYKDKIFVVEDRMHWTKGNYHIDIWFPSYNEALNFGAKRTYIEVLEN